MTKSNNNTIQIGKRKIGKSFSPFVIAEIGINHGGDINKAIQMVDDAYSVGCECVKFQCHITEDEMTPEAKKVIPANAEESIWDIIAVSQLSYEEDKKLMAYVESKGMIYLSTPFSRAAANRLESMGVSAYKIGSGECNNYPLIKHIASFKKPIILSTGMNDISSISKSVSILEDFDVPYALLHCTSIYPTPYEKVRLGVITELQAKFPNAVIGLSDHTIDNYCCLGAVSLGASIVERHFASNKMWFGPDIPISMDIQDLKDLIRGSCAIHAALGGDKSVLLEEQATIDFAFATVVAIKDIKKGEILTEDNLWVKRPGIGEIKAAEYESLLGLRAVKNIKNGKHLGWSDLEG
ncbi:MAG: N-acetylneuraminate synthase family protein [Candidatus Omnitrophica bacterium]|nr:N-acetylneuraminate synthase family protein [Candidatus Omnitrophota bacterium]